MNDLQTVPSSSGASFCRLYVHRDSCKNICKTDELLLRFSDNFAIFDYFSVNLEHHLFCYSTFCFFEPNECKFTQRRNCANFIWYINTPICCVLMTTRFYLLRLISSAYFSRYLSKWSYGRQFISEYQIVRYLEYFSNENLQSIFIRPNCSQICVSSAAWRRQVTDRYYSEMELVLKKKIWWDAV